MCLIGQPIYLNPADEDINHTDLPKNKFNCIVSLIA